ncbi:MAG TPA: acyl-CoA dehydrogenase [Streptosporangiaceae bacterium]|nr:acyl-CoA dehydrogenase [Streptosporangiaceae bacterium]
MIEAAHPRTAAHPPDADEHVGDRAVAATAAAFAAAVGSGELNLPLPGGGRTRERWAALAAVAEQDLSLARLAEGHTDALAILAELGASSPPSGSRWGVWAAQPPGPGLEATKTGSEWRLHGIKRYCSGAHSCTDALVTAAAPDGNRLFAVSTHGLAPVPGSWPAIGMAASDTFDVRFIDIVAAPVGEPDSYLTRPGFAHGGAGVAACWYGGARGIAKTLLAAAAERDIGPHGLAHLGAVDIALHTARTMLHTAADEIDADPHDRKGGGRRRSLRLKSLIEETATEVIRRVGRALGAEPLCHDEAHARRVADLTVYLRQHHAERDLARLGELVAGGGTTW